MKSEKEIQKKLEQNKKCLLIVSTESVRYDVMTYIAALEWVLTDETK